MFFRIIILLQICFLPSALFAQKISGIIRDASSNESITGAVVSIKGTSLAVVTDIDGKFELTANTNPPYTLVISYIGFSSEEIIVQDPSKEVVLKLKQKEIHLKDVEVVGSRISEKQKEAPLTVESMDIISIKECPQNSFYEALGTLKGVDLTSASLGFTIVNTRGFNSTSPVRSLQLIDGVDNQSPGLNFSLGNFLGCSELDLLKVEMIAGASSAYFGPNAFNGVISMTTRSPFVKPGLEVSFKAGERNLIETSLRWAQVFKNKEGKDKFGYKFNLFFMKAHDWEATNDDPTTQSKDGTDNPGGYDAVNRYGDEYSSAMDLSGSAARSYPGCGRFYRTGYWEKDLVDYNTENFKSNLALHYKIGDSLELILASSFGAGTTVYQGDNRYSLKDITFFQNRIELRKDNKFFIRMYETNENAGNSYDAFFTALLLEKKVKNDKDWASDYYGKYDDFRSRIEHFPGYPVPADYSNYTDYVNAINPFLFSNYHDSLVVYHDISRSWADGVGAHVYNKPYLAPGTYAFDTAFASITSKKTYSEGGSMFYDKSALYHIQGEYKFAAPFADIVTGGNYRLYKPNSQGTIFADTNERKIQNKEYGLYAGIEKNILNDKIKLNVTARLDKNENFDYLFSPAASVVYRLKEDHIFRFSASSAIRNPTLTDQYLYYNVGKALLTGNLDGFDSLVTIPSLYDFFLTGDTSKLDYFNVDPVRPEKVRTLEIGYRGVPFKNLYIDLVAYYSWYTDFIGYKIGADITLVTFAPYVNNIYRVATNSKDEVHSKGFSIGTNYFLGKFYSINFNYTYNELDRRGSTDPLIPAFNTPLNKFNVGFSGRDIDQYIFGNIHLKNIGFNINFKWVQGFDYEGSPQFTGYVPSYNLVDAQVNYRARKIHSVFKIGASNLLNNQKFTVYGGPIIGRLAYFSILVELFQDR